MTSEKTFTDNENLFFQTSRLLQKLFPCREVNGALEVLTDKFDRHNDFLVFYLIADEYCVVLTDLGGTIADLAASGYDVGALSNQLSMASAARLYGAEIRGEEIRYAVSIDTDDVAVNAFADAMAAVEAVFLTR